MTEQKCRNLLRTDCSVAAPTDSVADGVRLLLKGSDRRVYVTDNQQQLLGIVPDYELLKCVLGGRPGEPLESLLSRHIDIAFASTAIRDIAPLFREARHSELPIVDDDRHAFLGVVVRNDVLRAVSGEQFARKTPEEAVETQPAQQLEIADAPREVKWLKLRFSRLRIDPADTSEMKDERPHLSATVTRDVDSATTSRFPCE